MSEEIVNTEKFIIRMLEHSIDTYIEGTKVTKVELTTEQAQVLLDLYNKQKEEIKELNLENQAFYEEMNCNDNEYISKKYSQLKENSISKDKIRDKIKELEEYQKQHKEGNWSDIPIEDYDFDKINLLKELLEE